MKERTMEYISSEEYMSGTLHSMETENVKQKRRMNDLEGTVSLLEEKVRYLWTLVMERSER